MKVALCLEETGLPYELKPNGKVPVIVDQETGATVFDSNAILLYLAEKTGQFLPENTLAARGELLSWLMFVATGVGPFSGQAVHFQHFAPEQLPYAVSRYLYEAKRHYGILDARWAGLPNLKRLLDEISARPAAQRAEGLKDKHAFKTEMDEEARRHMFRHLATQTS